MNVNNRPLHQQVIDKIKQQIDSGEYEAGEQLSSEFELSKQYGVSRATMREAIQILEDEHVLVKKHGVGMFVHTKPLFSAGIEELISVTDMISKGGKEPGAIFMSSTIEVASVDDSRKFEPKEIEELLIIERVRTADKEPVVYCLEKIPTSIMARYHPYGTQSMFEMLEKEAGKKISYAVTHIEPLSYHEKVSELLECDPETALLVLKQMHYDEDDIPVLYSINYFRADKFDFHIVRKTVSNR